MIISCGFYLCSTCKRPFEEVEEKQGHERDCMGLLPLSEEAIANLCAEITRRKNGGRTHAAANVA